MLEEVEGDLPFRPEHYRLGDARLPASLGVGQPVLGKVEVPVEKRVEVLGHIAQMDRHHAVVDFVSPRNKSRSSRRPRSIGA